MILLKKPDFTQRQSESCLSSMLLYDQNQTLSSFFPLWKVVHEYSYAYTPKQNEQAEQRSGQLLATTHAFLLRNYIPKQYWTEIVFTVTYLINRLPSRVLELQSLTEVVSTYFLDERVQNHLISSVFNVLLMFTYQYLRKKLDPRSIQCMFVKYSQHKRDTSVITLLPKKFYIYANVRLRPHFLQPTLSSEEACIRR